MIRGSKIELPKTPTRNVDINLSIHNRFDIEVIDVTTGEIKQKAEAYNIVLNQYWERLATGYAWFSYIHYGYGEGTPNVEDKGLFNEINNKLAANPVIKTFPLEGYAYHRKSIQLAPSDAVGSTITEVGIGFDTGTASLCTHAMLKDMNGNQISIQKTDTDVINIYATVFVHWNKDGYDNGGIKICFPKSVEKSGVNLFGLIPGLLGANRLEKCNGMYHAGPPTTCVEYSKYGTSSGLCSPSNGVSLNIDASTRTIVYTINRLNVGDRNYPSGIKTFAFGDGYRNDSYTHQFDCPGIIISAPSTGLPGTNIKGESIGTGDGTTVDFNTDFPFPAGAIVYIDGVPSTDVTVDENSPGCDLSVTHFWEFLPEYSDCLHPLRLTPDVEPPSASTCTTYNNGWAVFYNKCWEYGIATYNWNLNGYSQYSNGMYINASDDLINWVELPRKDQVYATLTVPEEYQHYKYWRINVANPWTTQMNAPRNQVPIFTPAIDYSKNIHFTTPPAEGSVITIDYYTPVVAKDKNHVFDLTVTVHLGEYTE